MPLSNSCLHSANQKPSPSPHPTPFLVFCRSGPRIRSHPRLDFAPNHQRPQSQSTFITTNQTNTTNENHDHRNVRTFSGSLNPFKTNNHSATSNAKAHKRIPKQPPSMPSACMPLDFLCPLVSFVASLFGCSFSSFVLFELFVVKPLNTRRIPPS